MKKKKLFIAMNTLTKIHSMIIVEVNKVKYQQNLQPKKHRI